MTQPPPLPRRILHVDMDAFFASVEQRDNPVLRGRPVLVGGTGPRGVVCAASYEARPFGCRSAQPMAIALRNCPHAIVVKPNGAAYREASNTVFDILHSFTPQVQPLSIDEAFLDVTGSQRRFGDAVEIATNIRQQIHQRTQLTGSIGVAPNKFLAKLASEMDKPDGLTIVPENDIPQWLAPRPIGDMWGVGPAAERKLQAMGVRTFGDVQRMDVRHIESLLGSWGRSVHELAHGRDEREVHPDRSAKSISQERTFGMDVPDPDELLRWLLQQTEQVSGRLRRHELRAKAVTVKIRYGDFKTITRSKTLPGATDRSDELWNAARELFTKWSNVDFHPVRLIGMGATVAGADATEQMPLFGSEDDQRQRRLDQTTDSIRSRFGDDAIRRARLITSSESQKQLDEPVGEHLDSFD